MYYPATVALITAGTELAGSLAANGVTDRCLTDDASTNADPVQGLQKAVAAGSGNIAMPEIWAPSAPDLFH